MAGFSYLSVRGSAAARGAAHGETFRERIARTLGLYLDDLFRDIPLSRAQLIERALHVQRITRELAPAAAVEIDAIATGAGLDAWQVYLLNARTEILNARVPECTALFFAERGVLAQNWDWIEPLEAECVVINHEREDGHRYTVFGEPGMVGKIGFSSAGIGVCLNILFAPHDLSGLPVHILIGALLNAHGFDEALELLERSGRGKASHLLVGSATGRGLSMEFFGDERYALEPQDGLLLHTNHCLGLGPAGRVEGLANSCARYDVVAAAAKASETRDLAAARDILSSTEGGEDALLRAYRDQDVLGSYRVGSCATILMELGAGVMHVRRGPDPDRPFTTYTLSPDNQSQARTHHG